VPNPPLSPFIYLSFNPCWSRKLPLSPILMSHDYSQSYPPQIVGDLIDGLRRTFTTRGQKELGDSFVDQSRELLETHLELIPPHIRQPILRSYNQAQGMRTDLENDNVPQFQKLLKAREYRRVSKQAYKIIRNASDKAVEGARTTPGPGVGPGNHFSSGSTQRHPFSNSRVMSSLTNVPVDDLQEVEMTTYQTEDTGNGAVVFDLHSRHAPTQHIVATFPTVVFSGETDWDDRVDRSETNVQPPTSLPPISGPMSPSEPPEVTTTLSFHRDDGSSPHFVTTSIPYRSRGRGRPREAETDSLSSASSSDIFGHSGFNDSFPSIRHPHPHFEPKP